MKTTLGSIAIFSALLVGACSSSSSSGNTGPGATNPTDGGSTSNVTCNATATGGTTGTFPCTAGAAEDTSNNTTLVIQSADGSSNLSLTITITGAPTATSYTAATVTDGLGDFYSTDKSTEWENLCSGGTDNEGTFKWTITDVGATTAEGTSTGYNAMHGTYTGTFVPKPGGPGGSGTSTLNVTF